MQKKLLRLLEVAAIVVATGIVMHWITYVTEERCPDYVAFEQTVAVLERCMASLHNVSEINDALMKWGGGSATELDILPRGDKERLVIFYPNDHSHGSQGRLVIFQQDPFWHVVYNAASIDFLKDWTDWEYTVLAINHDPYSGLDDVLIGTSGRTIHHTFGYIAILTGRTQYLNTGIHVGLLEQRDFRGGTTKFEYNSLTITTTIGLLGHNVDARRFTFDGNVYSLQSEVIDPPTAAIQLVQDMASRPTDPEVLGRAYSLFVLGPSSSPYYPDEQALLNWVKLKLFQRWILNPPSSATLDTIGAIYQAGSLFPKNGFEAELAAIFKDAWDTTHNAQRACQVMATFADDNPTKGLDLIRHASRGVLNLKGQDLCWIADSTF